MRLLASTDFALRVLMRLAATPETHVSTNTLARKLLVSRNHLHKIVQYLTEAGLVRTIRGARGGDDIKRDSADHRRSLGGLTEREDNRRPHIGNSLKA